MIVAIHGPAGSGKSTIANAFELHGFVSVGFADPLRGFVKGVFQWSDERIDGPSARREDIDPIWGISSRDALITVGKAVRELHEDAFVVNWARRIRPLIRRGVDIVVPDLRFPNEATYLRSLGARMVRAEHNPAHARAIVRYGEQGLPGPWDWTVPWSTPAARSVAVRAFLSVN